MDNSYQANLIDLPLCFRVGVTGHRDAVLDKLDRVAIEQAVALVLSHLALHINKGLRDGTGVYSGAAVQLQLTSALAEGADRLVAQQALLAGWMLHALLPFSPQSYKQDFINEASRQAFDRLLAAAQTVTDLAIDRAVAQLEGYAAVGKLLAKTSDILIAVWDEQPSRGAGGTAAVVEMALQEGVPVVWISATADVQICCISNTADSGKKVQQDWQRWLGNYIDSTVD